MKDSCIIKSFPNGINLILKEDVVFDLLLEEIGNKFEKSRPFFGNASVALSFEGRELTSEEETEIVNVIHKSSDIDVVCIMAKDSKTDLTFVKALQKVARQIPDGEEGYFFKGSLVDDNEIDMEQSVEFMEVCEASKMRVFCIYQPEDAEEIYQRIKKFKQMYFEGCGMDED